MTWCNIYHNIKYLALWILKVLITRFLLKMKKRFIHHLKLTDYYQFHRIPFGVTNGVACFQRIIDTFIEHEKVPDTYAYLDNVTICGHNQQEHDTNLKIFLEVAQKNNMTFNHDKSMISTSSINLLGYQVSQGSVKPDPERLHPFKNVAAPHNLSSLRWPMGMFAYISMDSSLLRSYVPSCPLFYLPIDEACPRCIPFC